MKLPASLLAAAALASCASAQFTPIVADGWMTYREVRHCAPTLAELVLSPTLFGRVRPGDEPMTLIIRWRDGSEQMARVKLEPGRACLDAWKPVEMVA